MTTFKNDPTASYSRRAIRSLVTVAMAAVMMGTFVLGAIPASAQIGDTPGGTRSSPETFAFQADSKLGAAHTTANLNLRLGPSIQTAIQTVMPAGSTVEITGTAQNGFYPVTFDDLDGFAHGDYLAEGEGQPAAAAPTASSSGSSGNGIVQIIYNAAAMYGQNGDDMLRVARCESVLNPNAVNRSSNASGLFQFLPSTWATTPYAGQNIFDPVANAEAAAWMWANGRRNEWVCQ